MLSYCKFLKTLKTIAFSCIFGTNSNWKSDRCASFHFMKVKVYSDDIRLENNGNRFFISESKQSYVFLGSSKGRRIENMEAALLFDERTDLDMAGHTRNWPISRPSSELAARMAVIGCQPWRWSQFVETKAVRWTQLLKCFNAASILSILLARKVQKSV